MAYSDHLFVPEKGDVMIVHTFATLEFPFHESYHYFVRSLVSLIVLKITLK